MFFIAKAQNGQYYWYFRAANNKIIATSGEYYVRKSDCEHGVNLVKGTTSVQQYNFYKDTAGEWRWHLRATNSQIIAASSEGYHNYLDCVASAQLLVNTNPYTPVCDLTKAA